MTKNKKIKGKEIVIILGRNSDFSVDLTIAKKLPYSFLDFFLNYDSDSDDKDGSLKDFIGDFKCKPPEKPIYIIAEREDLELYFIERFDYAHSFKIGTLGCILQTLIKLEKYNPGADNLYYFCHGQDFGKSPFTEGVIDDNEKNKLIESISKLLNRNDIEFKYFFLSFFFHAKESRIFSTIREGIRSQNLESIDLLRLLRSFEKERIKDVKIKLINTFLPLAIDMHGLSQTNDEKMRKKYKEEIIRDLELNADNISNEWNDIKKVLAIDSNQEILSEEYQLSQEQKVKIKFPLERGRLSFSKEEVIGLFKKDSWPEDEFLPKWLEQAVDILEKKIEGNSNQ